MTIIAFIFALVFMLAAIVSLFVAVSQVKMVRVQRELIAAQEKKIDAYKDCHDFAQARIDSFEKLVDAKNDLINTQKSMLGSQEDIISSLYEELEVGDVSTEFRDFSVQTVLRTTYMQIASNPMAILTMPTLVIMLAGALAKYDEEWYSSVRSAAVQAKNGDTSAITQIYKRCAQDLAMIRPVGEDEIPN